MALGDVLEPSWRVGGRAVILGGGLSRVEFQVVYASRRHLGAGVLSSAPLLADPSDSLSRWWGAGVGPAVPGSPEVCSFLQAVLDEGGTGVLSQPCVGSVPAWAQEGGSHPTLA